MGAAFTLGYGQPLLTALKEEFGIRKAGLANEERKQLSEDILNKLSEGLKNGQLELSPRHYVAMVEDLGQPNISNKTVVNVTTCILSQKNLTEDVARALRSLAGKKPGLPTSLFLECSKKIDAFNCKKLDEAGVISRNCKSNSSDLFRAGELAKEGLGTSERKASILRTIAKHPNCNSDYAERIIEELSKKSKEKSAKEVSHKIQ